MDEIEFSKFLKKSGKKPHVVEELLQQVKNFAAFLTSQRQTNLETANAADLDAFIAALEAGQPGSAGKRVRGLALYFRFTGKHDLAAHASAYREAQIDKGRGSFALKDFRGIDPQAVEKLCALQITTADQMLAAGKTPLDRQCLAEQTGVPYQTILELVKLSDLARLPGVKHIRARLYYQAGIDSVVKLAACEADELLRLTAEFVAISGFDGIPPLPKEVTSTIKAARDLPKIVVYE